MVEALVGVVRPLGEGTMISRGACGVGGLRIDAVLFCTGKSSEFCVELSPPGRARLAPELGGGRSRKSTVA
jgi:hypothetical protein